VDRATPQEAQVESEALAVSPAEPEEQRSAVLAPEQAEHQAVARAALRAAGPGAQQQVPLEAE
jgi:hypothetical protein